MTFKVTNDHEIIRGWIEEHGGRPAVIRGVTDTVNSLSIQFAENIDLEPISWEEFFDTFETSKLSFRYDPKAKPDVEDFAFNFVARDTVSPLDDKNVLLPEDNEMLRDNMFPSASNYQDEDGLAGAQE